ncbi:hypothetical protein HCH44_06130 [Sphingomonas melonis]|jgi:hypothetical protein|uniref:hypothetical protein n=1 Tax=Sphingomonas melonis TaxID=152682 RepID=UPI001C8B47D4|nr:hypothetical protein [Sphingomonas melonis]MBX8844486.1 hypothetical protein [Sphingomonas melonis]MBX8852413.1 hypothetical protein [Sphingomonas melonis]MBX8897828.1 hypothetical protein [Sphingomonas melonis]
MMSATWSASPAAGRCMAGEPFVLNGRVAQVEERFASHAGLEADALLIRFDDREPGQIGVLGTTVKSLEQHIAQGRIHFLESARSVNVRNGWTFDAEGIRGAWRRGDYAGQATGMSADPPKSSAQCRQIKPKIEEAHPADTSLTGVERAIRAGEGTRPAKPHPAALSLLSSGSWRSVQEACHYLWGEWRPEWGERPSYWTVRRWVVANRTSALARPDTRGLDERRAYK